MLAEIKNLNCITKNSQITSTLFAHMRPQALHNVLGPSGPRRIIGVAVALVPQ